MSEERLQLQIDTLATMFDVLMAHLHPMSVTNAKGLGDELNRIIAESQRALAELEAPDDPR